MKNLMRIALVLIISGLVSIYAVTHRTESEYDFYYISSPDFETETIIEIVDMPLVGEIETENGETETEKPTVAPVQPEYPYYSFIPLSEELQIHTCSVAEIYGINPLLVYAVMWRESRFNYDSLNASGEYSVGLMQINTIWHRERIDRLGLTDITDPYQNITAGIDYLAECINWRCDTTIEWALMAYNGGPSYADRNMAAGIISDYAMDVIDKLYEYMEEE